MKAPLAVAAVLLVVLGYLLAQLEREGGLHAAHAPVVTDELWRRVPSTVDVPFVVDGDHVATGQGPMLLVVMPRAGEPTSTVVSRGPGDHAFAAEPWFCVDRSWDAVAFDPHATADADAAEPARDPRDVRIAVRDGRLEITTSASDVSLPVEDAPRHSIVTLLAAHRARHAGENALFLACDETLPVQLLTQVWEAARAVGWTHVQFVPPKRTIGAPSGLPASVFSDRVAAWEWFHAGGSATGRRGEVLVCMDRTASWRALSAVLLEAARHGVWEVALVGARSDGTFAKLPLHVPLDRGR